jgi:hypothetical protein
MQERPGSDENMARFAREYDAKEPPSTTSENVSVRLAPETDSIEQRRLCMAHYWKGQADATQDALFVVFLCFALTAWVVWRVTK